MKRGGHKVTLMTIPDVARITGKTHTTVYKQIRNGNLKGHKHLINGRKALRVDIKEVERFLGYKVTQKDINSSKGVYKPLNCGTQSDRNVYKPLTEESIEKTIQGAIMKYQTQLMKPIEEQALYRLGRMEKEVEHLRGEKELLLQEVEQYKALPGPVEEITDKLKKQKEEIVSLEREVKELEEKKKELHKLHIKELKELQKKLEVEKEEIAEAWKKKVEELEKPWWKKLWKG